MEGWRRRETLSDSERAAVLALLDAIERATAREPIDGTFRRCLARGGKGSHWLACEGARLVGYAFASTRVPPTVEAAGGGCEAGLLEALRSRHPRFDMWLRGEACAPDPSAETLRALAFMTAPLPVPGPPVPSGFTLRAFVPGRDEASWLALNNLAFAGHPEQGSWSEADLLACEAEAWFDPSTFLLLERDGRLAAASWMRAHERPHGLDGELRVLSVHPDFRGLRLGEVAVSQGFAALARLGVSRATLYVDEANGSAMALYQRLGFVVARRDRLVRFGG